MAPKIQWRQLEAELSRKDLDLALGLLFRQGLTATETLRHHGRIRLKAELPRGLRFLSLQRDLRNWERSVIGRKVFHALRCRRVRDRRWIERYKKFLKPFVLLPAPAGPEGVALRVDPRGRLPKRRSDDTLYIEAGLAFGTGTHTTTQLAAELLAAALQRHPHGATLDVGCGTGILAMSAKRLGSSRVAAVDNDPEALRVARENLRRNGIRDVSLRGDLSEVVGRFPVIVANIGLQVLLELRPLLMRRLARGGTLILTGLLYRDCEPLLRGYRGLTRRRRINRRGWAALVLENLP